MAQLQYQSGFANHCSTQAIPGALPQGRNSPQRCPFGLYAEQLSGTAFTSPRHENRRSWLYRIRPSAAGQQPFEPYPHGGWSNQFGSSPTSPDVMRWNAPEVPEAPTDFIDGIVTWAGNGNCDDHTGVSINLYTANRSMGDRYFYNADAEMLVVPQQGRLRFCTELGRVDIEPCEVLVIPRGVRFQVELLEGEARGYLLENFGQLLRLPELGPLGSNGLANRRDFLTPVAWYEDREGRFDLVVKFAGALWKAALDRSPLDVVAWHGTYAPYKYDLRHFNTIGSISFDHPDPSIFTVLTSPSEVPGTANLDFVVFGPRTLVMRDTFRPAWYHRNVASEYMGLIQGSYDAKAHGFVPGGGSLHNCMSPHGPDAATFEKASTVDTHQPQQIEGSYAFMFETRKVIRPTDHALSSPLRQRDYHECWQGLAKHFQTPNAGG